jgi:L-malate glycosyltransferase
MKILFYSHTGQVSGAENILLLLLEKLDRTRFTPVAVCPAEGGLRKKIRQLKVPCRAIRPLEARFTWRIDLLGKYLFSFLRTFLDLRNEILKAEPDLVHANSIRAGLTATVATTGTKIPVFWHLQDELKPHPISTLIRLFVLFSKRTRLIPVSEATLESFSGKLLKTFGGERIPVRIVHNAIEPEKFPFDPANRRRIRREFGLSEDVFVLGIVGQITPRKGQLELIRAFAETLADRPDSILLVVGAPLFNQDREYLRQIEDELEKLNLNEKVRLLGQRTDVPAIMQALDALAVNSRSEALVVVAIEAMACGTPVIATDAGGTREMIGHRINGLIVPFGNEEKLKNAILELAGNPSLRRTFSAAGKKVVAEKLNAEKFIADLEGFFLEAGSDEGSARPVATPGKIKEYV